METVKIPYEQRTVLQDISWETYEHLLADHWDRSSPRFGVTEVWRYDGERVVVHELRDTEYIEVANSLALPWFTSDILTRLVEQGLTMRRTSWARKVREWARRMTFTAHA